MKDADLPLLEQAKKKMGDSLSSAFVECLRFRIKAEKEHKGATQLEKIALEFRDPRMTKSFEGEWLIAKNRVTKIPGDKGQAVYRIAITKRGRFLVYSCKLGPSLGIPEMAVFETMQQLNAATAPDGARLVPEILIAEAEAALADTQHHIELDI